ncbi:M10 family metallopeptidase C-terminal domain-containing protein [Oceanibium sediminis]|uniref:M10 family metallopeptidase C-terminal domain-containing protein n=1 Tax=Oceanibium sediminis TaxID=2026339 RepID=UPI00130066D6|nr:M10 family metallopeptidase C-terminal domain-containing protein [Oceanibium sediminis]
MANATYTNISTSTQVDSNPFLAGLASSAGIWGGVQRFEMWDSLTLTYTLNTGAGVSVPGETAAPFTPELAAAIRLALADISAITNLSFTEVSPSVAADIDFWAYSGAGNVLGYSYGVDGPGVFMNMNAISTGPTPEDNGLTYGGFNYRTVIHEILHNVGIMHPHDRYATFPGVDSPWVTGDFGLNQNLYTVMSYNRTQQIDDIGERTTGWGADGYGYGVMGAFDIAMLQALYGANMTTATGNDTYVLLDVNGAGTYYKAIWDAGGTDEIVYTGLRDVQIQLRAATLDYADGMRAGGLASSAAGIYGGFTIANGVLIENASGGGGNDFIVGNARANVLYGNGGYDILKGMRGRDELHGGDQRDKLFGGGNHDLLDGGLGNDKLKGGSGRDTIIAGNGADKIFGGPGRDTIIAGNGQDQIHGGAGNDEFHFDSLDGTNRIFDFTDGEDKIRILDGALDISELGIAYAGGDATITFGDTTIILHDVAPNILSNADFEFGFV